MSGDAAAFDVRAATQAVLEPVVGSFVARVSFNMAAKKMEKPPENLTVADLPALADALRPALRTLIGNGAGDALADHVACADQQVGGRR